MNVKIKDEAYCIITEKNYDQVFFALQRHLGEKERQLFAERAPGSTYLQWTLPGDGWIALSKGVHILYFFAISSGIYPLNLVSPFGDILIHHWRELHISEVIPGITEQKNPHISCCCLKRTNPSLCRQLFMHDLDLCIKLVSRFELTKIY